ncbi:MAG: hypothetical protein E6R05_04015 [Candidatus Moraniibacteriota bacterium]|nr:MAG: hypothetical protein E6R05_04015 [Candidatus Moranbacteria bacterium]
MSFIHMLNFDLNPYLPQIKPPKSTSHKGDNGRVLIIGGSRLFHAATFWSASMAAHIVDMVHFSSPVMENNDLMRIRAKSKYWDGIVVPYESVEHYIAEDDTILIGPGMERGNETSQIVNHFLRNYPDKKWIIDGGALQELDPTLLTHCMIITPNFKELEILNTKCEIQTTKLPCTILAKGHTDTISCSQPCNMHHEPCTITGGSPGLTKGGTGDILSGLVAALAAKNDSFASCVIASYCLKKASEKISLTHGPYFTPTMLINEIPATLTQLLQTQVVQSPN